MKLKSYIFLVSAILLFACKQDSNKVDQAAAAMQEVIDEPMPAGTNSFNWLQPPYKYWAIKNVDKLFPIAPISKGQKTFPLEAQPISFDDLIIEQFDGKTYGFEEHLDSNRTDGFLILHEGTIAYEKYFGNMKESDSHNWFSVSKSLTGTTIAILAAEGMVDLDKPTLDYIPELIGSAWDGTTLKQLMDMTVNMKFEEIYNDPNSDVYQFGRVTRLVEIPDMPSEFDSVIDYLKSVPVGDNPENLFHYVSLNTEILGMIIAKVTGKKASEIISDRIWSKLGAEQDAYVVHDANGHEVVSGAINSTLRDAGRFGQMILDEGYYNGKQIVPKKVIQDIYKGGSVEKFAQSPKGKLFKNYNYANQWWHTDKAAFFAKGLFGQWIYIDPTTETVVVKFTTSDVPTSTEYDWMNNMNLMEAIVGRVEKLN